MTFIDSGIYNEIMAQKNISIIDTTAKDAAHEEKLERRRQALLVDLFFTGTNAITENGYLVNLDMKTPCIKTGRCQDCKSSGRICNNWTINEKSFPKGRTKVILINQDMGI